MGNNGGELEEKVKVEWYAGLAHHEGLRVPWTG